MLAMERSVVNRSGEGMFMPHRDMLWTASSSIKGLQRSQALRHACCLGACPSLRYAHMHI